MSGYGWYTLKTLLTIALAMAIMTLGTLTAYTITHP